MNKTSIIIICSFVGLLLILLVIFILLKQKKKKSILNAIDRLTTEKNMIVPVSLITELNKAEKLANNKKLSNTINGWKKEFEEISNIDLDNVTNKIVELDDAYALKKYKECNELIVNIETLIYHLKAKCNKLLNEIKGLTESEERNRSAVVKLKSVYRDIIFKYNKNKDDYEDIASRIDLQFENIDKLFSGFEVAISNNEYEEISKIVKVLDDMIHNMEVVIDEAPTVILMAKVLLPKKMNDIKRVSEKMTRDGYNIEYLNIDYNISETNKKINEILDRLKVLNLENSIFDLKTLSDYFESLYNDFENEKNGKNNYERGLINTTERINKLTSTIKRLYAEIDNLKDVYDLKDEEIHTIDEINKELIKVKDDFKLVNDRSLIKVMPYSKLDNECELVMINLSKVEDKLEITLKNLGSLKEDESRARDQLNDIKIIINDSKHKIKDYDLPVIPRKFYVELKEAEDAVREIVRELEKKPISIKTLNLRVDTALDLALKLYQTTSDTIKTARMNEMVIVYGNRYLSSYKEVENAINESTRLFRNGEYKKSLELMLNVLNNIEPGIIKRILKGEEV